LFIDINTKQRPVPNELLLDIKKIAEYENVDEQLLADVFDLFAQRTDSPLLGLMSAAERATDKVSRVTFNAALRPLIPLFGSNSSSEIYSALSAYFAAFMRGTEGVGNIASRPITNPQVFRAISLLFADVAPRVQDKFGKQYTIDNFDDILRPVYKRFKRLIQNPGNSYKELYEKFSAALKKSFTL
jgi:hypothetical protein